MCVCVCVRASGVYMFVHASGYVLWKLFLCVAVCTSMCVCMLCIHMLSHHMHATQHFLIFF